MLRNDRFLVLAAAAAGVVLATVLTLLQPSVYRADASIALVRQGQAPGDDPRLARAAEAAAQLLHSRAVAEPTIANLGLDETAAELLDRVSLESDAQSSLVRIELDAPSRNEARRTAQELVEVATVLHNDRFGPAVSASVWEKPSVQADRVAPRPARNLALGALLGALAGWALSAGARRPARPRLEPAAVRAPTGPVTRPVAVPASEQRPKLELEPHPEPEREPDAEPETAPAGPFVLPRLGEWTVRDVERLLAEQGPAYPDRVEELRVYLDSFRDVAEPGGRLPDGVEGVLENVFADLIERARRYTAGRPAAP